MKTLIVEANRSYEVKIERGLLKNAGEYVSKVAEPKKALIVTDSNVEKLYLKTAKTSFEESGFEVYSFVFGAGEESKNLNTLGEILTFLAESEFTGGDILIALGGGVVGDVTGLCASLFLRGIKYVQIPTTLLASVDSSVGGKTAVDLKEGKNLVGTFWQPSLVLIDADNLKTLKSSTFSDGMAEAVKCGVIKDEKLFSDIENGKNVEDVIYSCIKIKADIVKKDEFDRGIRHLLNFGHTFGHAIEKLSDFKITHGSAVSIGMVIASGFAESIGYSFGIKKRLVAALEKLNLPIETEYTDEEIAKVIRLDKKRNGDKISVILPKKIGEAEAVTFTVSDFEKKFIGYKERIK